MTTAPRRSGLAKHARRRAVLARYADRRAEPKRVVPSPAAVPARREQGRGRSRRGPRDARPTRGRDRDGADGRPRGHPHASGPSRVRTRAPAHTGHLPDRLSGVRGASR
ncbi:30S ribosomal protein S14 [Streptomyces sp. TRM70308]